VVLRASRPGNAWTTESFFGRDPPVTEDYLKCFFPLSYKEGRPFFSSPGVIEKETFHYGPIDG